MIAFTIVIGNKEQLTGGIKDMTKNQVLSNVKLENISQIEFGVGNDTIFVTETDDYNRPYKVKKVTLSTLTEQTLYVDHDKTHYIDIGISKDKKYLLISSNTKEDSEILAIERTCDKCPIPTVLVPRTPNVKAHVEHLRDFFIQITNLEQKSKNYKLTVLKDQDFETRNFSKKWEDIITSSEGFIINDFDGFKDFIAIYIKNQGRPEIVIQDLDTKKFTNINMNDVGEIYPGLNADYTSQELNFIYTSPFVYEQVYKYNHKN